MRVSATETVSRSALVFACLLAAAAPAPVLGETRAVRLAGKCDLAKHDSFDNALVVRADGRMRYSMHVSCSPFVRGDWIINPILVVANKTDSALHCLYYVALFDRNDRLVGCCHQGSRVDAGKEALQFGSCIVHGPKARLLAATRFDAVIYESDRPIGVEAVSADAVDKTLAGAEAIVSRLASAKESTREAGQYTERRATADIEYRPRVGKTRNAYLSLGDKTFHLYLNTVLRETVVVRTSGGKSTRTAFEAWRTDVDLERRNRDRTIRQWRHVALLDAKGRLVVSSTYTGGRDLYAPPDYLLAAEKLHVVVYEVPAPKKK